MSADRELFDDRFVRAQPAIFRYVAALMLRMDDAEEVFQETCLTLLRRWEDYDPERPFEAWAIGIAKNLIRKSRENAQRRIPVVSNVMIDAVSEAYFAENVEADTRMNALSDCLDNLSDDQRQLVQRCYSDSQPVKAIAESLEMKPHALYKRMERIRHQLFECIERSSAEE